MLEIIVKILYILIFLFHFIIVYNDIKYLRIPNRLLIIILMINITLLLLRSTPLLSAILPAMMSFFIFFIIYLLYPQKLGMGDVKYSFVLFLRSSFLEIFYALFIASSFAILTFLLLYFSKKDINREIKIAFAPFLLAGSLGSKLCI